MGKWSHSSYVPAGDAPNSDPQNLIDLVVMCARSPSMLADVGTGGISGRSILIQVGVAFVGLAGVNSAIGALLNEQAEFSPLAAGLLTLVAAPVSLLTMSLALYFLAQLVRPSATFGGLLTGLAFLSVLTGLLELVVFAFVGTALLLGHIGVLPEFAVGAAGFFAGSCNFVLSLILLIYFLMGVFQMGCIGSFVLGIVAAVIASAVNLAIFAAVAGARAL
jgi:hypothetical protein